MNDKAARDVVLFGAGDFAEVAAVYLTEDSPHRVAAFTVHGELIREPSLGGIDVVPYETLLDSHPPDRYAMFVAIGYRKVNQARARVYRECKEQGYELITYVSSRVSHQGNFRIGENCFVFENNVIQPFVEIGDNVILWSGNHVGHHARIGDHCFVASHAVISGRVTVGPYCFLGVNAAVGDGVQIGPSCVIGAGALILRDTGEGEVYAAGRTEASPIPSHELRSFQ